MKPIFFVCFISSTEIHMEIHIQSFCMYLIQGILTFKVSKEKSLGKKTLTLNLILL